MWLCSRQAIELEAAADSVMFSLPSLTRHQHASPQPGRYNFSLINTWIDLRNLPSKNYSFIINQSFILPSQPTPSPISTVYPMSFAPPPGPPPPPVPPGWKAQFDDRYKSWYAPL